MFLDGVMAAIAVILVVNGWRRGLIQSWRGPLALVLATISARELYVDFSTWLVWKTRISPACAVVLGYLMLWLALEIVLELTLGMVVKWPREKPPNFLNRLLGSFYGFSKALVIFVLPVMVSSQIPHIPAAPEDKAGLKMPALMDLNESFFLPSVKHLADMLRPAIGGMVVSSKEPSFKPIYNAPKCDKGTGQPEPNLKDKLRSILGQ